MLKVQLKKNEEQNILIIDLKEEKSKIEALYYKEKKDPSVKKENLAKYRKKKKDTRSMKKQIEVIVGKGEKWIPHSCNDPKTKNMGKPKGAKGRGRKRPTKIHQTVNVYPDLCPNCQSSLSNEEPH